MDERPSEKSASVPQKKQRGQRWKTCCGGCCLLFVLLTIGALLLGYWYTSGEPIPKFLQQSIFHVKKGL
ncbi:MAG TPA: hypothetical protein VFQ60_00795 [Patescibacteria group bacterium]|nr:hypothetical protein [Patescibacteria group bacterium]